MHITKKLFLGFLFLLLTSAVFAQISSKIVITDSLNHLKDTSNKIIITEIILKGNSNTKDYVILREIPFYKNDTVPVNIINEKLEQYRRQVYNTRLFSDVLFDLKIAANKKAQLIIRLKERWYTYPYPQFKLIDRNFDVWYYNFNASLQRVSYGIKFLDYNFSGRKDQLSVNTLFGLNQNYSFNYSLPYLDKKYSKGFSLGGGYVAKKILPYNVSYNDSLMNYSSDSSYTKNISQIYFLNASFFIRKGFFKRHVFSVGFANENISDTIFLQKNNPNYFGGSGPKTNILDLSYSFQYQNVDNISYPRSGKSYTISLTKRGLGFSGGINALTLSANYNKYFNLGKKWYLSSQSNTLIRLPFQQAFINQTALGYSDIYLRGLDLKVINGVATLLQRSTIKKELVQFKIPLPFKIKEDRFLPFSIYAKSFFDMGYVYNRPAYVTSLNNKFLYTGGIGIDVVSIYDISFRLEYCLLNTLNKNHLFLHSQGGF